MISSLVLCELGGRRVNTTSGADSLPGPNGEQERAPRKNLLLAAEIVAGSLKTPVRIRNLSESGALLDGAVFPDVGVALTLRRLELEIGATVVWRTGSRCGVKFEGKASVPDWVAGKRVEHVDRGHQLAVDRIQAAIRSGAPVDASKDPAEVAPAVPPKRLDHRIADEIAYVRRLLGVVGDELTNDPIALQRHAAALQSFDLACQTLDHLAAVMKAEDQKAVVDGIGIEGLRARLQSRPMFRE